MACIQNPLILFGSDPGYKGTSPIYEVHHSYGTHMAQISEVERYLKTTVYFLKFLEPPCNQNSFCT